MTKDHDQDSVYTLANPDDAYKFYRGMDVMFTEQRPWWRRAWRWLVRMTRRRRHPGQVMVVSRVDGKKGVITFRKIRNP